MIRRLALLCLALTTSAHAAPAPLPRRDRGPEAQMQTRTVEECRRRLAELGVTWEVVEREGRRVVWFEVTHPSGSGMGGGYGVQDGDLLGTLQDVIRRVESFLRNPDR